MPADTESRENQTEKEINLPGLMNYAHTIGSAVIKPEDMGKIRGKALAAMREQTRDQMTRIYEQMNLLASQARAIRSRVEVSEKIYMARIMFEPIISQTYYLYEKPDGANVLSMVSPVEWGKRFPFKNHLATVRLLSDHTWEVIQDNFAKT